MEWISVKDELPETPRVIVCYRFGVGEAIFLQGTFYKTDYKTVYPDVTHWMPLPEPPKP